MFGFEKNSPPKKDLAAKKMMQLFIDKLDREEKYYIKNEENNAVSLSYQGENFESLTFTVIFDDDGLSISIRAYSIVRFKKNQLNDAYKFCNDMNNKFRWVKFFIDYEDDLTASLDAVITPDTADEECYELLCRTISIVDSACEILYS